MAGFELPTPAKSGGAFVPAALGLALSHFRFASETSS